MTLKPQDIFVLMKLLAIGGESPGYKDLAASLCMSPSEVHASAKRAVSARLAAWNDSRVRPICRNLEEFLLHGVQYAFAPDCGGPAQGMPTGYAAEPLVHHFIASDNHPPVWPDPEGPASGYSFAPLYRSAPAAAKMDKKLYELLVLIDALRAGRAREKKLAGKILSERIGDYVQSFAPKY